MTTDKIMAQIILKKLPSPSNVAQLSNLDLHSFTDAFNANAITPSIARVELIHNKATVVLGDFAWEVEENDWYEIASESADNNRTNDAVTQLKSLVKAARSTSGYGESAIAFTNELESAEKFISKNI